MYGEDSQWEGVKRFINKMKKGIWIGHSSNRSGNRLLECPFLYVEKDQSPIC